MFLFALKFAAVFTLLLLVMIWFIDMPVHLYAISLSPQTKAFFSYFSALSDGAVWLVPTLILAPIFGLLIKNRLYMHRMIFIFTSVAGAGLINMLLKMFFGRYRPYMYDLHGKDGFTFFTTQYHLFSFPSGHTNTITAAMLSLTLFYPRLWYVWVSLIALGASSRVVLAKHYPSDTLAGALVAFLFVSWLYSVYHKKGIAL